MFTLGESITFLYLLIDVYGASKMGRTGRIVSEQKFPEPHFHVYWLCFLAKTTQIPSKSITFFDVAILGCVYLAYRLQKRQDSGRIFLSKKGRSKVRFVHTQNEIPTARSALVWASLQCFGLYMGMVMIH